MFIPFLFFWMNLFASDSGFLPKSFKADYEESYFSTTQQKEIKSQGTIEYQFPKHLRFQVLKPDPSLFVSNPQKSWYYTPPFIEGEEGQVIIQNSNDLALGKLLDELKNGLKTNANYEVKKASAGEIHLKFLNKKVKELKLSSVVLKAQTPKTEVKVFTDIKMIDLIYESQKKVTLHFKNMQTNVSFNSDYFDFKIPQKTKVTQ